MQPPPQNPRIDPGKTRVLVVDDDPTTLQMVSSVLDAHGYAPVTAPSAEQALSILGATPDIRIAITDISMPGMDGIVFLERISSQGAAHSAPAVIFLTAHRRLDFAVAALRLGAADFLTKPVRPQELLQAVKTALGRVQRSPDAVTNLAQQAEALAAALKGWAQLLPQKERGVAATPQRKAGPGGARDFALIGMDQVRRLRRSFPPLSELDDIAWDLMLELMRAESSAQRISVSALCTSIEHVSSTTALRRLQDLVKAGHIVRSPDPADARRDFVVLSPASQSILDQYLERVAGELAAAAHVA